MAEATLNQILLDLSRLEPQELEQVSQAVRARLGDTDARMPRQVFHESLLASGLVRQIKPPRFRHPVARRLAEVEGKPVSETLIEERR